MPVFDDALPAESVRTGRLSPDVMPNAGTIVPPPTTNAGATYTATERQLLIDLVRHQADLYQALRQVGVIQ